MTTTVSNTRSIKGLLVPADITQDPQLVDLPTGTLRGIYDAIGNGCSMVEPIDLLDITVWADEEASYNQKLTNARATMLLRGRVFMEAHGIKGNVVITGTADSELADVPAKWLDRHHLFGAGVGLPGGGAVVITDMEGNVL